MGLEAANFIPELVITNPAGADPVSQGDDHIRTLKNAILGSFPAFVGTTGVPKSITLTEDQINDAARKAAAAIITGLWDFTTVPTIAGDAITTKVAADAADLVLQNLIQRPTERNLAAAGASLQTDQGLIVRYTGPGAESFTVDQLLADTEMTLKHVGAGILTIAQGAGVTIDWLDGAGGLTGNRSMAAQSVIELHWASATLVEIWGNGLS